MNKWRDGPGSRPGAHLVVSVHDVAPATAWASRRWVELLDRLGVPTSLLVIPGPWRGRALAETPGLATWLRRCAAHGHEIALHGWDHTAAAHAPSGRKLVERVAARGCAEFWGLDEDGAADRVRWGQNVLAGAGLAAVGFTPPGWLASGPAVRGVRRAGVRYVTSHTAVTDLDSGRRIIAPALCHRPGGRGERIGAALLARVPGMIIRSGRTARIGLHPADLTRPGLAEAALAGIEAALALGARPVTYEQLLYGSPGRAEPARGAVPGAWGRDR